MTLACPWSAGSAIVNGFDDQVEGVRLRHIRGDEFHVASLIGL
jgi:hypothetical protein